MNTNDIAELRLLREELRDKLSAITKSQIQLSAWLQAGEEAAKMVSDWIAAGRQTHALNNDIAVQLRDDLARIHKTLRRLNAEEREPWQNN